jgi:hypothetical protein
MKVLIIGDSNIGDSADNRGNLGRALAQLFTTKYGADVTVVGVRSSTAGQWVVRRPNHPSGKAKDTSKGRGIFRPFSRLSTSQRARTNLDSLRRINPDLVVINFASNDAAGYARNNPQAFVDNAKYLKKYFGKPVIWFDGGYARRTEPAKRPLIQYAKPRLSARDFLFIDSGTPERRSPFEAVGARPHPPVRAWASYLALPSVQGQLDQFVRRTNLRPWTVLAVAAAGVVAGIFLLG